MEKYERMEHSVDARAFDREHLHVVKAVQVLAVYDSSFRNVRAMENGEINFWVFM